MSARRRFGAHAACALTALGAVLLVARAHQPPGYFPKYLALAASGPRRPAARLI